MKNTIASNKRNIQRQASAAFLPPIPIASRFVSISSQFIFQDCLDHTTKYPRIPIINKHKGAV
jgi:hypothetical protein